MVIANLGKYNEGYLVGAWFTFPIDEEDVKEKIGLNEQSSDRCLNVGSFISFCLATSIMLLQSG